MVAGLRGRERGFALFPSPHVWASHDFGLDGIVVIIIGRLGKIGRPEKFHYAMREHPLTPVDIHWHPSTSVAIPLTPAGIFEEPPSVDIRCHG